MTGNDERTVNSKDGRILPVIVIQSILFPATIIKFGNSIGGFSIPENVSGGTKYLALKNDAECESGQGFLWKIGTICSLEKNSEGHLLRGELRAKVVKIWRHKNQGLVARINELKDIPPMGELTEAEMPMLFGCVESIRRFLKKWQEKIPKSENELYKKVSEQIGKIEAGRRETGTIYLLPWFILVNFPYFFSLSFKEEMLKTDKVIDRLLSVAEKLQQEISIFSYAESFSDVDTGIPIKLENGAGDK